MSRKHSHSHSHGGLGHHRLHTHPLTSEAILDFRAHLADHRRALEATPEARRARRGTRMALIAAWLVVVPVASVALLVVLSILGAGSSGGHL